MRRESLVGWVVTIGLLVVVLASAAAIALETRRLTEAFSPESGYESGWPWFAYPAMLLVGFLFVVSACARPMADAIATPALAAVGFAAMCFATAHYYAYDDYRFPELIRVADLTDVPHWSFVALWLAAVAVGIVALVRPRIGLLATGAFLWIVPIWTFLLGPFY